MYLQILMIITIVLVIVMFVIATYTHKVLERNKYNKEKLKNMLYRDYINLKNKETDDEEK